MLLVVVHFSFLRGARKRKNDQRIDQRNRNYLLYGDCLTLLKEWNQERVDLIYLDPPFDDNRNASAIYKDATGSPLPVQIGDMWPTGRQLSTTSLQLVDQKVASQTVIDILRTWANAWRDTPHQLISCFSFMAERLTQMNH